MEFGEKLQQLRKQKRLTQEELAAALFVSRTAVSKWESGRGYPGIDSLKAIAAYFSVSLDELLSGGEWLAVAEKDGVEKAQRVRDRVFGLLDCAAAAFLFLPMFGREVDGVFYQVPLFTLTGLEWYMMAGYIAIAALTTLWGVATLALQGCSAPVWTRSRRAVSLALSVLAVLAFIGSREPYAALLAFLFLSIKGGMLFKRA